MSTLGDSLWQQFGGDVPDDPRSVAAYLIQKHGSGRAAARAIGVDEAQIRRWKAGSVRHSPNVARVSQSMRADQAAGVAGPLVVKFRHAGRDRTVALGGGAVQKLAPGTEARVRDAYVRGDREGMADALASGVADPNFYGPQIRDAHRADKQGMAVSDAGEGSDAAAVLVA